MRTKLKHELTAVTNLNKRDKNRKDHGTPSILNFIKWNPKKKEQKENSKKSLLG